MLSVLAALRLDDDVDNVENTLTLALVDSTSASVKDRSITTFDTLASSTWENVTFLLFLFLARKVLNSLCMSDLEFSSYKPFNTL